MREITEPDREVRSPATGKPAEGTSGPASAAGKPDEQAGTQKTTKKGCAIAPATGDGVLTGGTTVVLWLAFAIGLATRRRHRR